jgi:hypothetical protein
MGDDRRWIYDGWKRNGAQIDEWWEKTDDFIERTFSLATTEKIRCPCMTKHLVQNGFTAYYKMWVFHGE